MLSVNLPQITLSGIKSNFRIAHLHANLPGVLARVNRVLGEDGINIAAQALGTEGEIWLCGHRCGAAPGPEGSRPARLHRGYDPHARDQLSTQYETLRYAGGVPTIRIGTPPALYMLYLLTDAAPVSRHHSELAPCSSSMALWKSSRFSKFW